MERIAVAILAQWQRIDGHNQLFCINLIASFMFSLVEND